MFYGSEQSRQDAMFAPVGYGLSSRMEQTGKSHGTQKTSGVKDKHDVRLLVPRDMWWY